MNSILGDEILELAKRPYQRQEFVPGLVANNVEEAVEKIRQYLLEREKVLPEGVPHTLRIHMMAVDWDCFNFSSSPCE